MSLVVPYGCRAGGRHDRCDGLSARLRKVCASRHPAEAIHIAHRSDAKGYSGRRAPCMILRYVAIHLADEHAAIAMPNPLREGHEIDTAHHRVADEIDAQMVETKLRQADAHAHSLQRLAQALGGNVLLAPLRTREKKRRVRRAPRVQLAQQRAELRVEIDWARTSIL